MKLLNSSYSRTNDLLLLFVYISNNYRSTISCMENIRTLG
jgi:hypothetical protein